MTEETAEAEIKLEEILLHLDLDMYNGLIESFVVTSLTKGSNEVFNLCRSQNKPVEIALSHAIVNEVATTALETAVDQLEFADRLIAYAKKIKERYTKNNKKDNDNNDTADEEVPR